MAKLLKYDETEETIAPADSKAGFSLQELYVLIGCDTVQQIILRDGSSMFMDEDGKFKTNPHMRYNARATRLLHEAGGMRGDWVTGHVVICNNDELK